VSKVIREIKALLVNKVQLAQEVRLVQAELQAKMVQPAQMAQLVLVEKKV
jgi:hypothetical protein